MDRRETLAETVRSSETLLTRYLAGFNDETRVRQAPGMPNHVAWTLGHCALTMHRVAEMLDNLPLPADQFIRGDGAQGDATRFDTESVAFASVPAPDADIYPLLHRATEIYQSACTRLADACLNSEDEHLDEPIPWHAGVLPLYQLVLRVCFHNGTHAGQIIDLRRALDLDPIIK